MFLSKTQLQGATHTDASAWMESRVPWLPLPLTSLPALEQTLHVACFLDLFPMEFVFHRESMGLETTQDSPDMKCKTLHSEPGP